MLHLSDNWRRIRGSICCSARQCYRWRRCSCRRAPRIPRVSCCCCCFFFLQVTRAQTHTCTRVKGFFPFLSHKNKREYKKIAAQRFFTLITHTHGHASRPGFLTSTGTNEKLLSDESYTRAAALARGEIPHDDDDEGEENRWRHSVELSRAKHTHRQSKANRAVCKKFGASLLKLFIYLFEISLGTFSFINLKSINFFFDLVNV